MIQEFPISHILSSIEQVHPLVSVTAEVGLLLVADFELTDKAYDKAFMRSPSVRDSTVPCFLCLQVEVVVA